MRRWLSETSLRLLPTRLQTYRWCIAFVNQRVKQRAWEGAIMGEQDGEIYTKRYEIALYGAMRFVIACVPSPLLVFHRNPDSLLYIILIFTSCCFRSGERIRSVLDQSTACTYIIRQNAVPNCAPGLILSNGWSRRNSSVLATEQYPSYDYEIMKVKVNYLREAKISLKIKAAVFDGWQK